jgi:hypothetical protein
VSRPAARPCHEGIVRHKSATLGDLGAEVIKVELPQVRSLATQSTEAQGRPPLTWRADGFANRSIANVDAIDTFGVSGGRVASFRVVSRTRIRYRCSSGRFPRLLRFPAAPQQNVHRTPRRSSRLQAVSGGVIIPDDARRFEVRVWDVRRAAGARERHSQSSRTRSAFRTPVARTWSESAGSVTARASCRDETRMVKRPNAVWIWFASDRPRGRSAAIS